MKQKKRLTLKQLDIRVSRIESELDDTLLDKVVLTVFGYLALVFVLVFHILTIIFWDLIKPIKMNFLTEEEKAKYEINGEFNEFEYLWKSLGER